MNDWKKLKDLPYKQESEEKIPCVVVWQDSEHATDQGVTVCTLQDIRCEKYKKDRIKNAYWKDLTDHLSWKSVTELPPKFGDEFEEWDVRTIVNIDLENFVESTLAEIRDGDFSSSARWISVMDAPVFSQDFNKNNDWKFEGPEWMIRAAKDIEKLLVNCEDEVSFQYYNRMIEVIADIIDQHSPNKIS